MNRDDQDSIWIKTEPSLDGQTYVVTIEASADRAVTLTPDSALRHAGAVMTAVARAEHDAAVYRQLGKLVPDQRAVGELIVDLRADRPELDHAATEPLRIQPGVNQKGKPFLVLFLDDKPVGQWDPADARHHALGVIEAVAAADLDAGYYRCLRNLVGIDENRARHAVADLINHRLEEEK